MPPAEEAWPRFSDARLDAVMLAIRERVDRLRRRGRFFLEAETGPHGAELLVVGTRIRADQAVTLTVRPKGSVELEVRGPRREADESPPCRIVVTEWGGTAAAVADAFEDTLAIVTRDPTPEAFEPHVRARWSGLG